MRSGAVPRAERSGFHRVVDVEVGDLRQAIAALDGVATLARAHSVGPRALTDLLPELRTTCMALPATIANALLATCDVLALSTGMVDEARAVIPSLVSAARAATGDVLGAIDAIESKNLGAKTRISLQRACDHAVERLAPIRCSVELLQRASIGEPVTVALDEVLGELDNCQLSGPTVTVLFRGEVDTSIVVYPQVAVGVLQGMLSCVRQLNSGDAFTAAAELQDGRLVLEFRPRSASDGEGEALSVSAWRPAPYDELVLRLAAATLAAQVAIRGNAVRLNLLRV